MGEQDSAELRRMLLKEAMQAHGLNPTDLARKAGFKTPNVIYNFLHGYAGSLSAKSYEAIVAQMPGLTIHDLLVHKTEKSGNPPVFIKTYCQANVFRDEFLLALHQMRELPLPVDDSAKQAGAYAALVKRPGAEEIYPAASILLCVPMERYSGSITKGRRLIIERFQEARLEVTVREVLEDADGRLWLSQRSTEPRLQGAVKMPAELGPKPWQAAGERYAIASVVIGAFIPKS